MPQHHDHDHDHDHDHHGHDHAHHHNASSRVLLLALLLTAGYALVEVIGGWWTGSLALLSDAGHMLTDSAALGLALLASWVGRRPADQQKSYGYARAEVLGALVNSLAMLVIVLWIAVEAVARLLQPQPVNGGGVMLVAVIGLLVNIAAAWLLSRGEGGLNTRAALLHVLGDLLGSVAAIAAGAIVYFTGWQPIDPILSLLVALLILRSTWRLLLQSANLLMEGVPAHVSYPAIGQALAALPGVHSVHDLHIWQLDGERVALSAHLLIDGPQQWPAVLETARRQLAEYGIAHVTLQPAWHTVPQGRVILIHPKA